MEANADSVKEKLESILTEMSEHHWLFTKNPGNDFSRSSCGKLPFNETLRLILSLGKTTLDEELVDYFGLNPDDVPSASAFVQRRHKILPEAFEFLFHEFAGAFPQTTHQFADRYCVLGCDGTHVVYTTNSEIIEDFNKPRMEDYKGYNHMHLNALVDTVSKAILDVVIQPGQEPDEREALHTMLDHFNPETPETHIVTADRGYESYDLIFHLILKRLMYVLRAKSPTSPKSLLSSFADDLPEDQDEYDVVVKRFFTDHFTKEMKQRPEVYHYMNPSKNIPHFQPLLDEKHLVYISFRVVKLKFPDGSVEYLITNLPSSLGMEDIRECYHLRWGCETAFRYLKHAAGLLYFHAKLPDFLKQEIYATLTMYNFGVFLANEASRELRKKKKDPDNKYEYEVDFSMVLRTSRKYFLQKAEEKKGNIIKLLCRFVHAVKEKFRVFPRPLRGIGAIRFNYR